MGRIYIVRHGQASLLEDDYDRLSPLGETQARRVGEWLGPRVPPPRVVASGPLRRQLHTARTCIASAGWAPREPEMDEGFDECNPQVLIAQIRPDLADPAKLGAFLRASQHPRREFHALFERAFASWLTGRTRGQGGLDWTQFKTRATASLRRVAAALGSGECAVIVTSGGPIAAICQSLLGVPDERVVDLHHPLRNAAITELLTRRDEIGLSAFNSVAHLELSPDDKSLVTYR
jgi:broad specificity phosphatase PhoE